MTDDFKRFQLPALGGAGFLFAGFLLVVGLLQSYVIVEPGQRGVSVTLGTVDTTARAEGISFKIPFVEQVFIYNVKQQTQSGKAECYSADLQTVEVEYNAFYRLPESTVTVLHQQFQGDPYPTVVDPLIQESIKQVVANYKAEEAVKKREEVRLKITDLVQRGLVKLAGDLKSKIPKGQALVTLVDLPITNIQLTTELEHAIERKQIEEQEALRKEYELQKTRKQAEIIKVQSEAEAAALSRKSSAIASNPKILELEMKKLELEMTEKVLQKWNGQSPTTVVVGDGGGNVLLPLR